MKRSTRIVAASLSVLTAAAMTTVATAGPAAASSLCSVPHPFLDQRYAQVTSQGGNVNARSGPYTSCSVLFSLPKGTTIQMYCYAWGESVNNNNMWTYLRSGTKYGWMASSYLTGGGAGNWCGV